MPKIVQYVLPPGGTVVQLADNNTKALEIESVDNANDYIFISTEDGEETVTISAGGSGNNLVIDKKRLGTIANYPTGLFEVSNQRAGIFAYVAGSNDHIKEYIQGTNSTWQVLDADGVKLQISKSGAAAFGGNIEIENASPTFTFDNNTAEDTDGGRESQIDFTGLQSGGEAHTLGRVQVSHDGSADDQKGKIVVSVNDGSDGATPTAAMTIASTGNVSIGSPTFSRTLSVAGEFRVEADGLNDFFQVTNMSGAGSAGINGITQGDINFKLKSSNAYFGVLNDSATLFSVFQDGKITTSGETAPLCVAGGIHIVGPGGTTSRTSINAGAGTLVIEDNGSDGAGLTIISDDAEQCKIDFFTDSGASGQIIWQQSIDAFRFFTNNKEPLRLYDDGVSVFTGDTPTAVLDVKGTLSTSLTGTFTATNSSAEITAGSSTDFLAELDIGSAIQIFESDGTSRGVFTVIAIASATALTLDSAVSGLSSSPLTGMTGKTDRVLLKVQTGDAQTAFAVHKPGHIQVMDNTATNGNIIIGDETCADAITTGTRNTVIGRQAGTDLSSGVDNTIIGDQAGFAVTTGSSNTFIGRNNRGGAGATEKCTMVGADAGYNGSSADETVCVGYQAGNANSGLKYYGNNSVLVGNHATPAASGDANVIAIGHSALGQGANTAVIGDSNIVSLATGGDGVCSLGTATKQFGKLHSTSGVEISRTGGGVSDVDIAFANVNNTGFYAAANNSLDVAVDGTGVAQFKNDRGLRMRQGSIAQFKGTASDTTTSSPMYLKDTNATLVIRMSKGNVGNVTLAASVTAVQFHRVPEDGEVVTFTAHFTKSADTTARTIDYTASAVTVYSDDGSSAVTGEIYWPGGVPHTMSTGNGAVDIVQFTCMPVGSTFNIYATVIGQGFAVAT